MHKIVQSIQLFIESIESQDAADHEVLIEEFGENCKKALRECLLAKRNEEPFRLRMSNIGKPLRQLLLEKLHGRSPMDAQMRLKMTYGYIWESFLIFLLKASGLKLEEGKKVTLDIPVNGKLVSVDGTMDLKIDGEIYDVKSASSWAFDNKFTSFETLSKDDPFGYVGQGFGYGIADKSRFAGWIVVDKSDGRIKVVEVPKDNYNALAITAWDDFKEKVLALETNANPPECSGVVEETFMRNKTGNLILSKNCEFCSHKYKCHPSLKYMQDQVSKAKDKKWKYYVKVERPSSDGDT